MGFRGGIAAGSAILPIGPAGGARSAPLLFKEGLGGGFWGYEPRNRPCYRLSEHGNHPLPLLEKEGNLATAPVTGFGTRQPPLTPP
jgi:hypothetical protein